MVFDSSALIALIEAEPGSEVVDRNLPGAIMSTVNLGEVAGYLARLGASREEAGEAISRLPLQIVEPDLSLAIEAGLLLPITRRLGLSLGDRFCIALGKRLKQAVLTADRLWANIAEEVGVEVQLIR